MDEGKSRQVTPPAAKRTNPYTRMQRVDLGQDLCARPRVGIDETTSARAGYMRAGDVSSSRFTSGLAAGITAWVPVTISLAPISLPYSLLLASLSGSIDAPSRDTPAKSPLDRE